MFSFALAGAPADIFNGIEHLPEDDPLSAEVQSLLVRALGRLHTDPTGNPGHPHVRYLVEAEGNGTPEGLLTLRLTIQAQHDPTQG